MFAFSWKPIINRTKLMQEKYYALGSYLACVTKDPWQPQIYQMILSGQIKTLLHRQHSHLLLDTPGHCFCLLLGPHFSAGHRALSPSFKNQVP